MSLEALQLPETDRIPAGIRCAEDYEALAAQYVPAPVLAYISGGSARDVSVTANRDAFAARSVCPRILRDVTALQMSLDLPGVQQPHPLLLAPVAHQKLVHARGELESARAAAAMQAGMVCSTLSNHTLEDIAGAGRTLWFQLYAQPQRVVTADLLRRAVAAGYKAIVLTVDAPVQVPSLRAQSAGFVLPEACVAANLQRYAQPSVAELQSGSSRWLQGPMRHAPQWSDLQWLCEQTPLPVWVKGVLHADDARALCSAGIAGIIVSNHGGRGLDGTMASLDALPAVREAVGNDYPLLFDSGIRSGLDVFKALALGADGVLIGRLQLYALAVAGALGVAHMIRLLREELELAMALAGCASLAEVRQATLVASRTC